MNFCRVRKFRAVRGKIRCGVNTIRQRRITNGGIALSSVNCAWNITSTNIWSCNVLRKIPFDNVTISRRN